MRSFMPTCKEDKFFIKELRTSNVKFKLKIKI